MGNLLEPFDITVETLEVDNFLSIRSASIGLCNITSIIGPQASGKSVLAKLFYFGRVYLSRFTNSVYSSEYDTRTFKKEQVEEFASLFGGMDGFLGEFTIQYCLGNCAVEIYRTKNAVNPKIRHSKEVDSIGVKLKREYKKYSKQAFDDAKQQTRVNRLHFRRSSREISDFFMSVPDVLFVPASRSFYATVSEELFTFLASDERVDPLTAQFGSFYEFAKRRIGGEASVNPTRKGKISDTQKTIKPVINGEFVREKSRDYIVTDWGRVPLRSASSGQQEALPLLLSLLEFPTLSDTSQLLIIEEPEAHLFPDAQKYVLDLIVYAAVSSSCDVLFTTHSPYVLACLNTHIALLAKEPRPKLRDVSVQAYLANDGGVTSILDDEEFIDTEFLDQVSEQIANEFLKAI